MNDKNMQPIENSIKHQMEINQSKNLLFANVEKIMEIEPDFLAALEVSLDSSLRGNPSGDSTRFVAFAAQALLKKITAINQYLSISTNKIAELEEIYRQTWQTMVKTGEIGATLRSQHYPELSRWLAGLYPKEFQKRLKDATEIGHVVYEEYSTLFQIELLGLDVSQLKQPVLDIGCGSQANLVKSLRSQGIESFGFDRHLEIQESYVQQIDWFDYPLERGHWGTIVSNMAFTNHLNYVHLHDATQLEAYLLKMRDVLDALKLGGEFIYAPSLPFVEEYFAPERFSVKRENTSAELSVSRVTKLAES
jgi:hypothetical protein